MLRGSGPSSFQMKRLYQISASPSRSAPTSCPTSKFPSDHITREALRTVFANANNRNLVIYRLQITESDADFLLPGSETLELYLELDKDFTVKVLDAPMGTPTGEKGHWTVVYN